jgi:nicotinamide riboside transporter PnuC
LWLVVGAVYVGLWAMRESYFFSALNILYLVLATYGFIQWYKSWKSE